MIKIAVCDDNKDDAIIAREIIRQTAKDLHVQIDIDCYYSAYEIENMLLNKKKQLDVLILDIDIPGMSGLELAGELRKNNMNLIIVFLSNHEEFVFKAFEFQPFRYIRKTKIKVEMPLTIQAVVKIIEMQEDEQLFFHTDDGETKVTISEIMYFDTEKRKVALHLQNGNKVLVNKKISGLLEIINKDSFIMIHRSCVVNANYIKNISNDTIILDNDEKLIISRPRCKEVRKTILRLFGELI